MRETNRKAVETGTGADGLEKLKAVEVGKD